MTHTTRLAAAVLGLLVLCACDASMHVNGSVSVPAGKTSGEVTTVNGGINIGARATVTEVHTVNGGVTLGEGAKASSMAAVNGSLTIGATAQVKGDVETINGAIRLAKGSEVGGKLANINGSITLDGAHLAGQLRTVNGPITLVNGARIDGGILMEQSHGFQVDRLSSPPRVVIGRGVTVNGRLKFERKVTLYVSDAVQHLGPIEGATPITYSGEQPPD